MKKIACLALITATALLAGCASYSPTGMIYNNTATGLSANNGVSSVKTGVACSTSILALVATGDSSIAAAKRNGNISKVASVDYKVENILGIYGKYCTIVKGE